MAISINYDMDQGANFAFGFTATDAQTGLPRDFSAGVTAYAQMRRHFSSTDKIDFVTSLTGVSGSFVSCSLGYTGTAETNGIYFYDVVVHINGNTVERLRQGMITSYPKVTQIP
jgi:hypothetical protein